MSDIDEIDVNIVNFLIDNGRMSAADISRKLPNVTERIVRYRIRKLLKDGIIQIGVIVKPESIGYSVVADVFLEVEPRAIDLVANILAEYELVTYVAYSIGQNDISIQVVGKNNSEIYEFITNVIGCIPQVKKTVTSIVPRKLKDVYQWRIPKNRITTSIE